MGQVLTESCVHKVKTFVSPKERDFGTLNDLSEKCPYLTDFAQKKSCNCLSTVPMFSRPHEYGNRVDAPLVVK